MAMSAFLTNVSLWKAITNRVHSARKVDAAIAYFGHGGARLLPLKKGDRLIVDMSPATVRAGSTDPREIEKLIKRGVKVFSRRGLHAKVVLADKTLICGSTNVSKRSQLILDEAAILTTEVAAIRRAQEFLERLRTEPVGEEYLQECKRIYKPPRVVRSRSSGVLRQRRTEHAKLWLVNLSYGEVPDAESDRYKVGEAKADELIKVRSSTSDSFHWPFKPKMAGELELGDWIIQMIKQEDGSIRVYSPGRFLFTDHYVRDRKSEKERWVFHLEVPKRRENMTWAEYWRAVKGFSGVGTSNLPRTRAVRDIELADRLLELWTAGGRVSRA